MGALLYLATICDSASYVLATAATKDLTEEAHPSRRHRVFWAVVLGLLPTTLIFMGGLRPLQSALTLASLPLLIISALMSCSLWKNLSEHPQPMDLMQK